MVKLRIDKILEEQGRSKYWLCKEMHGMSWQNLNNLIIGRTKGIRFDTLDEISKILQVPVGELFEQIDD